LDHRGPNLGHRPGKESFANPVRTASTATRIPPIFPAVSAEKSATNYSRVRDFLAIALMSDGNSSKVQKGCAPGGWRNRSARVSAKHRSCAVEFALAALAQDRLMDFMSKLKAYWQPFAAPD
jgi:hypothetical protein